MLTMWQDSDDHLDDERNLRYDVHDHKSRCSWQTREQGRRKLHIEREKCRRTSGIFVPQTQHGGGFTKFLERLRFRPPWRSMRSFECKSGWNGPEGADRLDFGIPVLELRVIDWRNGFSMTPTYLPEDVKAAISIPEGHRSCRQCLLFCEINLERSLTSIHIRSAVWTLSDVICVHLSLDNESGKRVSRPIKIETEAETSTFRSTAPSSPESFHETMSTMTMIVMDHRDERN